MEHTTRTTLIARLANLRQSMSEEEFDYLTLLMLQHAAPIESNNVINLSSDRVGYMAIDDVVGFVMVGQGAFAPPVFDPTIWRMRQVIYWLMKEFIRKRMACMLVGDKHPESHPEDDFVEHCIIGSGEELPAPELEEFLGSQLFRLRDKDMVDAVVDSMIRTDQHQNHIQNWINDFGLTAIVVSGLQADMCPGSAVLSLLSAKNRGEMPTLKKVVVLFEGMATYSLAREVAANLGLPKKAVHPQAIMHHFAMKQMSDRAAIIACDIILDQNDGPVLASMPGNLLEDLGFKP